MGIAGTSFGAQNILTPLKNMAVSANMRSPRKERRHHLVGSVVICILLEIVRSDIISAIFATKYGHKVTRCKGGTKTPLKNTVASKIARSAKSLGVVRSTYETDCINRRQMIILTINGQKVKLPLDTASDISLI